MLVQRADYAAVKVTLLRYASSLFEQMVCLNVHDLLLQHGYIQTYQSLPLTCSTLSNIMDIVTWNGNVCALEPVFIFSAKDSKVYSPGDHWSSSHWKSVG